MNGLPPDSVRVRLAAAAGQPHYAEFSLPEADLAWFVSANDMSAIDEQAAELAWALSHIAAGRRELEEWGLPPQYRAQVAAFEKIGRPGMAAGELAQVTLTSGECSVWRCTREGWHLLDRQPAAQAEMEAER